jgi:hypothetical protein
MTTRLESPAGPAEPGPAARFGERALEWLRTLIGLSVFGLLLVLLFPGFSNRSAQTLEHDPWASLGLGFGVIVGVPIAAVLLFVAGLLIGGWWIGPLLLVVYFGALPVGYAIAALLVGRVIMQRVGRPHVATGWSLLAGLVVFGLASLVPVAGGLALFMALLFGLGAGVLALTAGYRELSRKEGAPPPPEVRVEPLGEPMTAR